MLLVRPGHSVPVFSISPGGEVIAINLEMPTGYALQDLRVDGNNWVGFYTQRREDGNGLEVKTAVHDPATGKIIARYGYSGSLGLAVACVNQGQISFLTTQDDGKLILNTFSIPASAPSKEMSPHDGPH
jgi:ActR/RegA family two-component response regulator